MGGSDKEQGHTRKKRVMATLRHLLKSELIEELRMNGVDILGSLPDEVKAKIVREFGSMNDLYRQVFGINHSERMAHRARDQRTIAKCDQRLLDIEDKLEELGVEDGSDITTAIASDYGDLVVKETIENLNRHLNDLGTDFNSMREYIRRFGL